MTSPTTSKLSLSVSLHPHDQTLPAGAPMKLPGRFRATASIGPQTAEIHLALGSDVVAEQRWAVDQAVRKVASLCPVDKAKLLTAAGISDDTTVTIALDLHQRTGSVTLPDRPNLLAPFTGVARAEDGFRAWVNEDPATRTSLALAEDVTRFAADHPTITTEILSEPQLKELGMNLLLAVGQGSTVSPSRLVIARYQPAECSSAPLMLLGKGITFDTGGINLKPYESYVSMMKNDMAGAALAFHLFRALVEAQHPEPLLLVLPTCENAIGSGSMRPGALVTSHRGHQIRIDHTDAEGRLVLADALSYATDTYQPDRVVCFATLTTAALIAYGPYATPVHFADPAFTNRLQAASRATGEDLHFFPERIWHMEANRDEEADLRNTGRLPGDAARGAGSRNAAHFLRHFTDLPFTHFDIFASTWNWSGEAPGCAHGATGAPLRTVLRALRTPAA